MKGREVPGRTLSQPEPRTAKAQIDVLEEQLRQSQLQTEQATVDAEGRVSGRFFLRCRMTRTKHITYDIDFAARLWSISEALYESRGTALSQLD